MPRQRKRAPRKKSTVPKVRPGETVDCVVLGEQLESVLASFEQIAQSVLLVPTSVAIRRNRKEIRDYVDGYLALIGPIITKLIGKKAGESGISSTHPKWPAFLKAAAKHRTEAHTLKLHVLSLAELEAEGVRISSVAIDLLVEIGALLDDVP